MTCLLDTKSTRCRAEYGDAPPAVDIDFVDCVECLRAEVKGRREDGLKLARMADYRMDVDVYVREYRRGYPVGTARTITVATFFGYPEGFDAAWELSTTALKKRLKAEAL